MEYLANHSYYGNLCAIFYDATKKFASSAELNFYTSFMQPQGRVLEAMTGSGRLQIPLMQAGYMVDGVDCSLEMLERCKLRSASFGLVPSLYQQYLHQLDLPHKYQTVVIAVGSFQLITDYQVALTALIKIREHMLPDGDLLFSVFDPCVSAEPWSKRVVRLDAKTVLNLTTRRQFDIAQKTADAYCNYELLVNGQLAQAEQEMISIVRYSDCELNTLLDLAGFKIIKTHDYPLPSDDHSRIIQAKLKL
jgi:ubiquinone/menaquinone biosynthesis C-methylase UbiE